MLPPPSSLLPAFAPANIKEAEFHNGDVLEHFGTVLGKGLCHVAPIIQLKLAIALENYLDFSFFCFFHLSVGNLWRGDC